MSGLLPGAPSLQDHVLVPGRKNRQQSAAGCRASCATNPRCSVWLWCGRSGGCDDGRVWAVSCFCS